ncbi:MAG TPA: lipid-A-disaccharide synthase [Chthoniobacterales bacterium]|jgi:lipid-A-disaccharide synthase|nr:lipid-A-disaccharide synthase [Chthoniobacterales bacterium]
MKLYFVAGEASGDEHGAALMRRLRELSPELVLEGRGGPQMAALAGGNFVDWIEAAGIVGLWEVVKHYSYFRAEFAKAQSEIEQAKPDAVVLIDYPGFNLRLARTLRQRSPGLKIIYYISPQVWAWNRGRITKMARFLDLMLCIFPFEAELYNASGLRTIFVGHPMIENLAARRTGEARDPKLVGLFPGSRSREVRKNFPVMLESATELAKVRDIRLEVAAASQSLAREIEALTARSPIRDRVRVVTGDSSGVMQRASAGMVASGTATLESAFFRMPFVLVYRVSWPTYFAARAVMQTRFLGMPNVLADREIIPEFLQHEARPAEIARAVLRLREDTDRREKMLRDFDEIIAKLGETGASAKAAHAIMAELGENN